MSQRAGQIVSLEDSYRHCVALTKERARNFHFAFQVLPKERYRGICALYAFARLADDYSDEESDPRRALAQAAGLRSAMQEALAGRFGEERILPALADTVRRYKIDPQLLEELLVGTEMDATVRRYPTWKETYRYCYRVASVIGIMTIHVFGFEPGGGKAVKLAERLGIAFQLTNILRDIKEDAARDRIYLPLEDLERFGISERTYLAGSDSPAFRKLIRFEVQRGREYYAAADELLPLIDRRGRHALAALVAIYGKLLEEMERREYDVLSRRVSLSAVQKMKLAGGSVWKSILKTRPV